MAAPVPAKRPFLHSLIFRKTFQMPDHTTPTPGPPRRDSSHFYQENNPPLMLCSDSRAEVGTQLTPVP